MISVLVRAGCFATIILIGYLLRRYGFFKADDFHVLSKIVLKITLPAAIISSFNGKEIDPSMLMITGLGLAFGVLYIVLGYVINVRGGRDSKAFSMLNLSGYNIGNFTMPFAQSFLGPLGVVATSLFDTGNAFICLGGAAAAAGMVKGGGKFSLLKILKKLVRSVPFDCYIVMIVLALMHWRLPSPVIMLADIIGQSNAFMAMLMIGVGFHLSGDRKQLFTAAKLLSVRYIIALALALACYFLLPLQLEYRQALTLLVFSPIASAAPAFTAEIDGDIGLSSAINSMSILLSIICIVIVLVIVL